MVNLSGALRALAALEDMGIVERIGGGRRQPVALRRAHPLATAIETLFAAEEGRVTPLFDRLKRDVAKLVPAPRSVWVEGPVAAQLDRIDDVLRIGILTTAKDVARSVARIESDTLPIQRDLDVTIEVRGLTEADLATMSAEKKRQLDVVLPVFGPPPASFLGGSRRTPVRRSHRDLDDDTRALAAAVAAPQPRPEHRRARQEVPPRENDHCLRARTTRASGMGSGAGQHDDSQASPVSGRSRGTSDATSANYALHWRAHA